MDVSDVLDVSDVWVNFLLFVRVVRVDDVRTTNLVLRSDPTRGRDSLSPRFLFFSSLRPLYVSLSLRLFVSLFSPSLFLSLSPRLSPRLKSSVRFVRSLRFASFRFASLRLVCQPCSERR